MGGGVFPQIQQDIDHLAGDAIDQLVVGMRRHLEMHPANDARPGSREELLADVDGDPMGGELPLMERLHEIPARVFENKWPEDLHPG